MLKKIQHGLISLLYTNYYGFKIKFKAKKNPVLQRKIRDEYCNSLLKYLNIEVNLKNPDAIPANGQYLVAINHRGILDPLITEIALEKTNIHGDWVAKEELAKSFFFGVFVRNAGTILLNRDNKNNNQFFARVKEVLKDGRSIYIFPEGTRNKTSETLIEFKGGANLIALKNRLDILPIYIEDNSGDILNNTFSSNQKQIVNVTIGTPIPYKERKLEEKYKEQFNL
jgi:1-acyl-sn-glycerol-3-phosphate acyltransferase